MCAAQITACNIQRVKEFKNDREKRVPRSCSGGSVAQAEIVVDLVVMLCTHSCAFHKDLFFTALLMEVCHFDSSTRELGKSIHSVRISDIFEVDICAPRSCNLREYAYFRAHHVVR